MDFKTKGGLKTLNRSLIALCVILGASPLRWLPLVRGWNAPIDVRILSGSTGWQSRGFAAGRLEPFSNPRTRRIRMSLPPTQPLLPFTVVVPTVYGQMLVDRYDINQTNALFKSGYAVDHQEIAMLAQILQRLGTGLTVLDVGANFGTFAIARSRVVGPTGQVHAFEPQRLISTTC
jgi:hypothetical protein